MMRILDAAFCNTRNDEFGGKLVASWWQAGFTVGKSLPPLEHKLSSIFLLIDLIPGELCDGRVSVCVWGGGEWGARLGIFRKSRF
jgi:hypothetical protein